MSIVKHDETNECKSITVYPRYDEQAMEVDDLSRDHIRRESLLTNLGFAEPLENRRFSDQASGAKQNLDSLSRIPYGSEGLSGPQPGTP